MMKFFVKGQRIEITEREVIASGQIAFVTLKFAFDCSWKNLHKVVQFSQCDAIYNRALGVDGLSCLLPSELHPGMVKMSVFGYDISRCPMSESECGQSLIHSSDSDMTVRATTVPVTLHVRPSGFEGDADEALIGTKSNRAEFQKMLAACRNGEIDLVITKSISRFARNTVTLLETVRELKDLGVDVYFEEQNIHTMSADGELMLTILSSYAQEESFSASENQKWRIRRDFEQGRVSSMRMLGYRRTFEGRLEIIPEEAVIVRRIFSEYISGMGKMKIANMLNEENFPTINGCEWTTEDIRRILQNEKYAGNMLLQKAYRENHITKKCLKNKGELPQFYVEESHPAIIEHQIFEMVQGLIKKRGDRFTPPKSTVAFYPFTGKILCGYCGKNYRRKTTATGIVWICSTYNTKGKRFCPTAKQIPEEKLYVACCEALGISDFDEDIFQSKLQQIIVPAPNQLKFIFHNSAMKTVEWQDRSRSESWTDEMRKQAGQISKERRWHKCP